MTKETEALLPGVEALLSAYNGWVAAVTIVNEIEDDRKRVEVRVELYPGAFAIPQE